jgi:hydroxymethylpyrimidine pyrophosphatase-like HAD family hydrolase
MPDKLINVKADTAQDFMDNAHVAMRDPSLLGKTSAKLDWSVTKDGKTKKIKKVSFTLTTEITRVHWAGLKRTKPDKANAAAIKQIEELNKAHEDAHRAGYEKAFKKLKAKLEKDLVGKDDSDLDQAVQELKDALTDECEKLHKSGGLITVTDNGSGKITVRESAEGPGGCPDL